MFSKNNVIRILINTLIGILLIYFWLQFVNLEEIWKIVVTFNPIMVLPIIATTILANSLRAIRFKILLSEFKIPILNLIFLNGISQFLSFAIPLRIGELTKGIYLSTQYNLAFKNTIVWVLMDRFLDFVTVLLLALLLLSILPTALPASLQPTLLVLVFLLISITFFVTGLPTLSKKIVHSLSVLLIFGSLKKFFIQLTYFLIDASSFLNKGLLKNILIILITIVVQLTEGFGWYILLTQTSGYALSYFKILLGSLLSVLTYLIPSAPGYVGSAEAAALAVFSLGLGFDKNIVSAATIVGHALTFVAVVSFGLISLYLLKFDLNLVWKKLRGG